MVVYDIIIEIGDRTLWAGLGETEKWPKSKAVENVAEL